MKSGAVFRRNLMVVAALHVAFVTALFLASRMQSKPPVETVVWLDGSMGGGEPAQSEPEPEPEPELLPADATLPEPEPETPPPALIQPPSEIPLATPEPATPKPATPKPATPRPETPKPRPKPATPKPPDPTPRKATPKRETPKRSTPKPSPATPTKSKPSPSQKPKATPDGEKADKPASTPAPKPAGNGDGDGNSKGPRKSGGGTGASEFGWYFSMIHDRLHTRWAQPTDIERGGADVTVLLKLRISEDGTITSRQIVKESGYGQMDESVLRAAEKVTQIDPLPRGLGKGGFFEVNVQFKLDQGQ